MAAVTRSTKRTVAIVLGVLLLIAVVLVGATVGIGKPSVAEGDVVVVDDAPGDTGTVSQEDLDAALEQSAARLGLAEVPAPEDEQYQSLLEDAMQTLILGIWVEGEAAERGVVVSDTEVADEVERTKEESFANDREFQQFIERSKFTEEDVAREIRLQLLRAKLEADVVAQPQVSDAEIEDFYEVNIDAYEQTETRDVRVILNSDEAQAQEAATALEADDSENSWEDVALEYSQDQATKDRGGLLEGLTEGQNDPQLEAEAFAAPEGEIVGPFETDRGFYVIQVVDVSEASTQPLEEASSAIEQQLVSAKQQQVSTDFQVDFLDKWTERTVCDPAYAIALCSNFVPPSPETEEGQAASAAVPSTRPIAPGTGTLTLDGSVQQGPPQGPQPAVTAPTAEQLPAGAVPIGPDGAPQTTDPAAPGATGAPAPTAPAPVAPAAP